MNGNVLGPAARDQISMTEKRYSKLTSRHVLCTMPISENCMHNASGTGKERHKQDCRLHDQDVDRFEERTYEVP